MCEAQLPFTVTALAQTIACGKTIDELALLGAVFNQLGDTLATLAAQKAICESRAAAPPTIR